MKFKIRKKTLWSLLALSLLSQMVFAEQTLYFDTMNEISSLLMNVGAGMALVLIGYQALHYITAESPRDRIEAKNSIKWIFIGIIILVLAYSLACGILGYSAKTYYGVNVRGCWW